MTDGSLKVKRLTLLITNCEASSTSKEQIKEDGQASFHPITVREVNDLEDDTESVEAPETSKNTKGFQNGPANSQSLKCHFP